MTETERAYLARRIATELSARGIIDGRHVATVEAVRDVLRAIYPVQGQKPWTLSNAYKCAVCTAHGPTYCVKHGAPTIRKEAHDAPEHP